MPSIGERLRHAREQQGRSLADLAAETCILSRYLAAIEADDPKPLPGEFFYRNFVRQYASALRLDLSLINADLAARPSEPEPDPLPALAAAPPRPRPPYRAIVSLTLLAGALLGGSALYAVFERGREAGPATEPAPVVAASQPAAPVSSQSPAAPPETVPSAAMTLAAREQTWVSVSANGRTVFRGTLEPQQIRAFEGIETARVITGNAAGLDVHWRGRDIGPIGPRGQVRLVLLRPDSWQIVSPNSL
jgi:transcriptional regulator with XRE-family HTH domain